MDNKSELSGGRRCRDHREFISRYVKNTPLAECRHFIHTIIYENMDRKVLHRSIWRRFVGDRFARGQAKRMRLR
jgi:hypothetical protein